MHAAEDTLTPGEDLHGGNWVEVLALEDFFGAHKVDVGGLAGEDRLRDRKLRTGDFQWHRRDQFGAIVPLAIV